MGLGQSQPAEIWLSIERNPLHIEKDLFDFSKEREIQSSNKVSFPSCVHLNPKTNQLQYSLLQNPNNEIFTLYSHTHAPHEV